MYFETSRMMTTSGNIINKNSIKQEVNDNLVSFVESSIDILEGSTNSMNVQMTLLGDANNTGTVTINEVQSAINQYLGAAPVQPCCDRDGNGSVTIAEVQTIMNNHMYG